MLSLSVAMCTYNGAEHVEEQLASIAHQERLPNELVISDDGSTDGTMSILERFARTAPFEVRLLRNPMNLGYSLNFEETVNRCTGDLIALADQDDVWYPQKLARLEQVFLENPTIDGVFSNGDIVDDSLTSVGRTLWSSFRFGPADQMRFETGAAVDALLRRNVVTGMAFAFRSSAREMLRDRPQSWIHDGWLAFLLAVRSSLMALPEQLVGYRIHINQQVGTPLTLREKIGWVRQQGVAAYLRHVRDKNLDEYRRTAVQFDDLARYLSAHAERGEVVSKVRAKAAHAHRGASALSTGKMRRWAIIMPHLADYAAFSPNGLRAIPRDLFI